MLICIFVLNMNNPPYKYAITKYLLAAILLLNVFTFSGSPARCHTAVDVRQTTLVVSSSYRIRGINYQKLTVSSCIKSVTVSASNNLSRLHSYQIKIRIAQLVIQNTRRKAAFIYQPKTIPQNAEDSSAFLLG